MILGHAARSLREHGTIRSVTLQDSAFLRACRRQPVPHTPVWFMRQAGRSLPEYRKLREGVPMLEACARPDMIVEITLQPVRRYNVDAAIFFSDIMVPLKAIGVDLDIKPGVGPVVAEPIRDLAATRRLRGLEPDDVPYVTEAIRELVRELGSRPLIGFAGGPFTLASYLIEGGPSRHHEHTKALMYGAPEVWTELMRRLSAITLEFLRVQIAAGASAVQLFDSWVGALSAEDYRANVLPYSSWIFAQLAEFDVPRIHFGVGTGELLGLLSEAGADVVGVDWRVPLDQAARRVRPHTALQGNLDPAVLFAPWSVVAERTDDVLARAKAAEGHVFNLGHGVLPTTDPAVLERLVEYVHTQTAN
ncbi:uroporphyrinogen decarboxylase [Thermobifida fusca YX]|jgi:uroporphyrinogen decarboxylase|uniref:Uroporphyrinogen decarboxylase n=2 Tax=Thermobifida fusca TaxID=2021 RepID=DCUP_THEFY|nr:RecName: Full=Uroporphyrinogen decarboxylase; Short=UPD; Short=URO-D [Thermobifida fusca YX]AAZ55932.1 uroporphyrinogen decarboxylase [Thermobifida fusca YX]QOS58447.1 uroporphyrinogen decarboxylase [Thermobifida fusca]